MSNYRLGAAADASAAAPSADHATLARYIQVYDDALDPELCAAMIRSFHALARFQRANGRGVRAGLDESRWTELDLTPLSDAGFRAMLTENMQRHWQRYVDTVGGTIPVPFTTKTSELILKRYAPDGEQRFQPHFDSLGEVSNRYLVFLWYLNDVPSGGETAFVDLGVSVAPKAGRLLMFPPYWMFQHEGRAPIGGDKYILSCYLLF
jgi:hypothetical protein